MSTASTRRFTLEEYLALEETSVERHEFYNGEIFAMAGGSPRHNRIASNCFAALHSKLLGGPCEPFPSDQRIRISKIGISTYANVSVFCDGLKTAPEDRQAGTNPRVIIEVLSPSTENYDRGQKFLFYQNLDSLQEYVLISQDEPRIDHYIKQDTGSWWLKMVIGLEETLPLPSLKIEFALRDIYERVQFGSEPEDGSAAAADAERVARRKL
jgi:Uma2 family endonuclease